MVCILISLGKEKQPRPHVRPWGGTINVMNRALLVRAERPGMGTDRHDVVIEEAERLWRMGG